MSDLGILGPNLDGSTVWAVSCRLERAESREGTQDVTPAPEETADAPLFMPYKYRSSQCHSERSSKEHQC